ncbi:glycoside hydrolase family 16 protein [Pseudopedobacter beijingensis]|uniref:Glycoside hydrolase family 16 protein n=1 Tax=Pseudopedobacter beijingensis TaxID=1207056 RepID=A0ABW4IGJ2_9SPHI
MNKYYIFLLAVLLSSSCSKHVSPKSDTEKKAEPQYGHLTNTITFSGYEWRVKKTIETQGPGPNYWSGENVWVDENGWLHLRIKKNDKTGIWECGEVASTQKFGYGTYQWKIEGDISRFDKNIVLGLFNYSGNNMYDEMDIEIARWGNDAWPNLNFTVYSATGRTDARHKSHTKFFTMEGTKSTHRFTWKEGELTLKSMVGFHDDDTGLIESKTFTNADVPISTLTMPAYMNLWLFEGKAPSDNKSVEIIIKEFRFIPL